MSLLVRILTGHLHRRAEVQQELEQLTARLKQRYEEAKKWIERDVARWEESIRPEKRAEFSLGWFMENAQASNITAGDVFDLGAKVVRLLWEHKEIPKTKVTAFNKAHKTFTRKNRPKSWGFWLYQNYDSVDFLLDAQAWPAKGSSEEVTFKVGPMTVINQTTQDPALTTKALQEATGAMKRSDVPKLDQSIYGEVYFVGDIARNKNLLARYYPAKDILQILVLKRHAALQLRAIIHEFGHRFWKKFVPGKIRTAWDDHHNRLRGKIPAVGEEILWNGESRTVKELVEIRGQPYIQLDNGLATPVMPRNFPTDYAATDSEEHFCEALALYCLGELPANHREAFRAIVVEGMR